MMRLHLFSDELFFLSASFLDACSLCDTKNMNV